MIGQPSEAIYNAAVAYAKQDNTIYDMDILNKLYRHQIGMLPNIYGLLNRNILYQNELPAEYQGDFNQVKKDMKLVHFTSVMLGEGHYGKPWNSPRVTTLLSLTISRFRSSYSPLTVHKNSATTSKHLKRAYMFYVTSKPYACSVMVMAERLEKFKKDPSIDIVALVNGIDNSQLSKMRKMGIKTKPVQLLKAVGSTNEAEKEVWQHSNTKFQIFKDWGYDKFVYLDADTLLMANIDHLFDLPDIPTFWAPRAYWLSEVYQPAFTTLLIVGKPSQKIYDAAVDYANYDNAIYDMDVLNKLYRHKIGFLPNIYGLINRSFYQGFPEEYMLDDAVFEEDFKLIHMTDNAAHHYGKPWEFERNKAEDKAEFPYFYQTLDTFKEQYNKYC
ncbi:hypothetical protein HDV06_005231 [Boothiomyces sp. JEL0866]|nr:hypothetical protein HDV06_005231 [Boothiomyces sp. JEL0866]